MKESVLWTEVEILPSIKRERLSRLEKALVDHPDGISWQELCRITGISAPTEDSERRLLQKAISDLNKLYCDGPTISRGPRHRLNRNGYDLAFPEQAFSTNDRKQLNAICRLVAFFEGAIPVKAMLQATGTRLKELQDALGSISDNIDIPSSPNEINYIKDLYNAIENRHLLSISYPRLNDGVPFTFAPYFIKRHNNKWFVLGRMYVDNPFEWTSIAISGISKLSIYKGLFEYLPKDDNQLRELKQKIKSYYNRVIGFHVPTDEGDPNKLPRKYDPASLPIKTVRFRFSPASFRYVKENPIHHRQELDEARHEVKLTVVINPLLIQRILSYGDEVEVITPKELRSEIHDIARRMVDIYETK